MRLLANNQEIPVLGMYISDDLRQYCSTLEVTMPLRLSSTNLELEDQGKRVKLTVLKSRLQDSVYSYSLVSVDTQNLLASTFEAFTGTATVKQILSRVGAKTSLSSDSVPSYWRIPKCKFTKLISYLQKYANFNRGGAPHFYIDISGSVQCYDLRAIYMDHSVTNIAGTVQNDVYSSDFYIHYPGQVELTVYSAKGITNDTLTFMKGYGKGSCRINDTTGHEKELVSSYLKSDFYSNYYKSRVISLTDVMTPISLGDLVSIDGTGKFVVIQRTLDVTPNTPVSVTAVVASPYENN